jgi:hypothetical protein
MAVLMKVRKIIPCCDVFSEIKATHVMFIVLDLPQLKIFSPIQVIFLLNFCYNITLTQINFKNIIEPQHI